MNWSHYQQNFFNHFTNTKYNICLSAGPGSGKTTTLLHCLNLVPKFKKSIFLSFTKTIVNELKERVPDGIKSATLHSQGYSYILETYKHKNSVTIDETKFFKKALYKYQERLKLLIQEGAVDSDSKLESSDYRECYIIQDICNYMRMTLANKDTQSCFDVCDHYGLEFSTEMIEVALECLNEKETYQSIDFTDMIYLPVIDSNIRCRQFDYIFLDEAQDLNRCQEALVDKIIKPVTGRLILVGDKKQSIYSFAGASIDSFERLENRHNTITLPLSISYRCPKKIVRYAQNIYPEIEYVEEKEEGEIYHESNIDEIRGGDMVVSRTTRPLIELYFQLLKKRVRSHIVGRDVESGLLALCKACHHPSANIFYKKLDEKLEKLAEEIREKKPKIKDLNTEKRYFDLKEKIKILTTIVEYNNDSTHNLVEEIKDIFDSKKPGVRMMTIHRSKGLECDRVFIVNKFNGEKLLPFKLAVQSWEKIQEKNLEFVAVTRAKKELHFINVTEA